MANLVRVIEEFNNETETKILWISFDLSIDLKTLFTPRLENISFIKVDNTIAVNLKNPDFRDFFKDFFKDLREFFKEFFADLRDFFTDFLKDCLTGFKLFLVILCLIRLDLQVSLPHLSMRHLILPL